jgi:hypothetical protein
MVDRAQILALQRRLSGKILFPTQSTYQSVLEIDNGRVEAFPRFIKAEVGPRGVFDFQQSVNSPFEPSTAQPLDLAPLNRTFVGQSC